MAAVNPGRGGAPALEAGGPGETTQGLELAGGPQACRPSRWPPPSPWWPWLWRPWQSPPPPLAPRVVSLVPARIRIQAAMSETREQSGASSRERDDTCLLHCWHLQGHGPLRRRLRRQRRGGRRRERRGAEEAMDSSVVVAPWRR